MLGENSLKRIIVAGIFILPFIGLIVFSNFFFPYITAKNIAFRLIVLIISSLLAILFYKSERYRPSFGTIGWSFLFFIIIIFLADILGQYAYKSFFSNFERMEGFFTLLLLFFYFVCLNSVMKTESIWENLMNVSLVSSVLMAIFGFVEKSTGVDRLAAQLGNSTYLGAFMLFNIFFAVFLILRKLDRKNDKGSKWFVIFVYALVALIDFYIFYYTGTRGALLGLLGGMIFAAVMFAFFEKHNRKLKFTGYGILVVIIITVGLLYGFRNSETVKKSPLLSRFSALVAAPTNLSQYLSTQGKSRVAIWGIALKGVEEKPILGWGQENFNYIFNQYYDPKIYDQEQWFDRAHNVFFDWLVAGGIIGLLSYLSMFFFGVYTLWKKKLENDSHRFSFVDKTILTGLLIAYFIHNFFVFDNITSYILFFTVLAYISVHEKPIHLSSKMKSFFKSDGSQALSATVFCLASVVGIYYLVIMPYISSTNLIDALSLNAAALTNQVQLTNDKRDSLFIDSLNSFSSSIDHGIVGTAEAREQILLKGQTVLNTKGPSDNVKKAYSDKIDSEMKKQLEDTPKDARYFLFYAVYLSNVGRDEESLPYFKKAEELSPNKQTILFPEAQAYIDLKKYDEASQILKHAFELETKDNESRMMYAMSLIYLHDEKGVEEILQPIKETDDGTDIRLMRAYYDTGQINKINDLLDIKLKIANRLSEQGDKQAAIKEVQEVVSINPAFKEKGDALMTKIQSSR